MLDVSNFSQTNPHVDDNHEIAWRFSLTWPTTVYLLEQKQMFTQVKSERLSLILCHYFLQTGYPYRLW